MANQQVTTYRVVLHSDLHFELGRHHELVSLDGVEVVLLLVLGVHLHLHIAVLLLHLHLVMHLHLVHLCLVHAHVGVHLILLLLHVLRLPLHFVTHHLAIVLNDTLLHLVLGKFLLFRHELLVGLLLIFVTHLMNDFKFNNYSK